ncbi:MAG: hypothetical protein R3D25_01475 [Geminicoccaceae bacterium]
MPAGTGQVGTATMRAPEAWLRAVERRGHDELQREGLTPEDLVVEALITGLRLAEGVPEAPARRARPGLAGSPGPACPGSPAGGQAPAAGRPACCG